MRCWPAPSSALPYRAPAQPWPSPPPPPTQRRTPFPDAARRQRKRPACRPVRRVAGPATRCQPAGDRGQGRRVISCRPSSVRLVFKRAPPRLDGPLSSSLLTPPSPLPPSPPQPLPPPPAAKNQRMSVPLEYDDKKTEAPLGRVETVSSINKGAADVEGQDDVTGVPIQEVPRVQYTEAENKAIVRKLDMVILPLMCMVRRPISSRSPFGPPRELLAAASSPTSHSDSTRSPPASACSTTVLRAPVHRPQRDGLRRALHVPQGRQPHGLKLPGACDSPPSLPPACRCEASPADSTPRPSPTVALVHLLLRASRWLCRLCRLCLFVLRNLD